MSTKVVRGLSVATYEKMVEKGVLPQTNRLELIEGRIVEKMTKRGPHSYSSEQAWRLIDALLPAGWHVRIEKPVRIPERRSEPEPDVSVVRGALRDHVESDPGPGDVALVVEVSRSSLSKDRKLARVYSAGAVPVYWVIDVERRRVEVFSDLDQGVYRSHAVLTDAHEVTLVIGGQSLGTIAVVELLPPVRSRQ